ncbi:MAG TPA: ATP-binding protein [Bryobacteraceae bacterium]
MAASAKSSNDPLLGASVAASAAPLESILCTEELQRRPSRPPDYERENRALVALLSALANSPRTIFQTLAETILDITGSDSAGLSLLTKDGKTPHSDGERFYWPAIAGTWNPHVGGGTPRNFGPCGDVLDCNRTLLFQHFERRYPYLVPVIPAAEECLLVPFYLGGKAVGTIWAIMHSDRHKFDAEDDRVMAALGKFASSAYQAQVQIEDLTIQVAEREKAESFARQKLETVGTLANGIAHDFNNILGAVLSQAEVAMAGLSSGLDPDEELKSICQAAERGSEIVRQLMVYAGKDGEVREQVDVSRIVEGMLDLLRVSASKHAMLKIDLGADLPAVRANTAQISQVVMNLVTNASEAMGDREGEIRLSTRRVIAGYSAGTNSLSEGENVLLEVSDTGSGMSPEMQARVFDPFFTTKSAGRGLGLAVVQGIVRSVGGTIHLVSELGKGTTAQILLPCTEGASEAIPEPMTHMRQPALFSQAGTILVVEDENALRQAVSKMLTRHGFSVMEARDGSVALDAIRGQHNPIDVLFLDMTVPGASGREVLDEARRLRPEMKVIVTSAYPKEMAAASLQTTIEPFIRKPYRLDDVVELIRRKYS